MSEPPHSGPGSRDAATLDIYERIAEEYMDQISLANAHMTCDLTAFVDHLPPRAGPVLDWGAGPGQTSAILIERGLVVESTDASPAMALLATELGLTMRIEAFEDLPAAPPRYRGIWSAVALCHAPRAMVGDLLVLAHRALLPGGVFFARMKRGTGEGRDARGRFFSYWDTDSLARAGRGAGFEILRCTETPGPSMVAESEIYANLLARKPGG